MLITLIQEQVFINLKIYCRPFIGTFNAVESLQSKLDPVIPYNSFFSLTSFCFSSLKVSKDKMQPCHATKKLQRPLENVRFSSSRRSVNTGQLAAFPIIQ